MNWGPKQQQWHTGTDYHIIMSNCASGAQEFFTPPGGRPPFKCAANAPAMCVRDPEAHELPLPPRAEARAMLEVGDFRSSREGKATLVERAWLRYLLAVLLKKKEEVCTQYDLELLSHRDQAYVGVIAFPAHVGAIFVDAEDEDSVYSFGVQMDKGYDSCVRRIFKCPDIVMRRNANLLKSQGEHDVGLSKWSRGLYGVMERIGAAVNAMNRMAQKGAPLATPVVLAVFRLRDNPWIIQRLREMLRRGDVSVPRQIAQRDWRVGQVQLAQASSAATTAGGLGAGFTANALAGNAVTGAGSAALKAYRLKRETR